jgi:structural maintenance of chromosome 4
MEVEKLNELRQQKLNRVKVVENDKDGLQGAKDEAEQYLTVSHSLFLRKSELYQVRKHTATAQMETHKTTQGGLEAELEASKLKLGESDVALADMEEKFTLKQQEHDETATTMAECNKNFAAVEKKDIICRENLKHAKAQSKKLVAKVKANEKKVVQLDLEVTDMRSNVETLNGRVETLTGQKDAEQHALDDIFESLKVGLCVCVRVYMCVCVFMCGKWLRACMSS